MMTPEKIKTLIKANMDLRAAQGRNSGVQAAKERMKNLLLNYYEDLIELAVLNQKLTTEVEILNGALEEADRDYNELKQELKTLKKEKTKNVEGE